MSGTAAAAAALARALVAARVLLARGNTAAAETALRAVHADQARDPDVVHLLGGVLLQRGAAAEALEVFAGCPKRRWQTALLMAQAARTVGAHGTVLECLEPLLRMAGTSDPRVQAGRRHARLLHSDALLQTGRGNEAEAALQALLQEDPAQVEAIALLGVVLQHAGRDAEAAAAWADALRLRPADAMLHYNRALALERTGAVADAQSGYEHAARLLPGRAQAWSRAAALAARRCDFDGEERLVQGLESALAASGLPGDVVEPLLATFLPLGAHARGEILRRQAAAALAAAGPIASRNATKPADDARPLRVGYLSADFGAHAVGGLLQPVLAAHDPARVDARLYALRDRDDALAAQYRAMPGYTSVAGLPVPAVAARIADDGIDVLVDLGGYTDGAMPAVVAARPAALQLAWLGFVGSMAAPFIDYQLVDAALVPPDAERDFSEALLRLPGSFLPLAPPLQEAADRDALRRGFGLPAGMLFACFNNAYKIDRDVLGAWRAILARVPEAHLLLTVGDEAQPLLRRHWQAMGGDPARLLFAPRIAPAEHLRRAAACDLFLDSFRYHAGATGVSAARAGLPVLCRVGGQPVARMGASLSAALGMLELAVGSTGEYVEAAVALAGEPARLQALRERLRKALQGEAGDPAAFARKLESAYVEAWRRHCAGAAPASFDAAR